MSLPSSEDSTYFSIKSLRLMVAVTFLYLVPSRLTLLDLTFSPHVMKLFF